MKVWRRTLTPLISHCVLPTAQVSDRPEVSVCSSRLVLLLLGRFLKQRSRRKVRVYHY